MQVSLGSVFALLLQIAMAVGPIIGYIPQYFMLKNTRSVGSFSPHVCIILITSMPLRIMYWFWSRFELALLFQAIFMLIAQCFILYEVYSISQMQHILVVGFEKLFGFIAIASGIALFILQALVRSPIFVDALGIEALLIEACLPLPQCIANYSRKSTDGLSTFMIYTWMAGDAFKTFYYYYRSSPIFFLLCGCFQLTVDCIIFYQFMWAYPAYSRIPVSDSDDEEISLAGVNRPASQYRPPVASTA